MTARDGRAPAAALRVARPIQPTTMPLPGGGIGRGSAGQDRAGDFRSRPREIEWQISLGEETLEIDPHLLLEAFARAFRQRLHPWARRRAHSSSSARREGGDGRIHPARTEGGVRGHDGKLGRTPARAGAAAVIMVLASSGRAVFSRRTMAHFALNSIQPPSILVTTVTLPIAGLLSRRPARARNSFMTADNRRILIIDDERPILMTLEALLGRHGYQPEVAANAATGMRLLQSKIARARPARSATARRRRPAHARADQDRSSRDAGDHPDRARFAEQRDRVDQARRLSFHQQTVRAGRAAQPGRESARETIAPPRNARAAREDAGTDASASPQAETRLAPIFKSKSMQQIDELITRDGAVGSERAHHRRERRRQGSDRERDSQPQPARGEADGETELRRLPAGDDRVANSSVT